MAVPLCIAALASSCTDRMTEDNSSFREKAELEVAVGGINKSRAIIDGTTLPESCGFAIYYNSEFPTPVTYEKGTCKLAEPIFLDEGNESYPVYAFYPDNAYLTEIAIDTKTQTDYLRGISVDANGVQSDIGFNNPKAKIVFDHILARITLNIHKDASVSDYYKLPDIFLGGDSENAYRSAVFNALTNSFIHFFPNEYDNIKGELKNGNYLIETADDVITVDFLVLPTETSWSLYIRDLSSSWYSLPATNYESGKQYIYDCTIADKDGVYLSISECDIIPWNNTDMPGVESSDLF